MACIVGYPVHPNNAGGLGGSVRNGMQALKKGDASLLEISDPKAVPLSRMVNYSGEVLSECAMGIFENPLGGRICAAGYYPWELLQSFTKARQIKNIFRYLSKDTLPAYVESWRRIFCWVRELDDGKLSIALINASLEYLKDTVVMIRSPGAVCETACVAYNMKCEKIPCTLVPEKSRGGYTAFTVASIPPWQMVLIINNPVRLR
jgi:hypothetical protein